MAGIRPLKQIPWGIWFQGRAGPPDGAPPFRPPRLSPLIHPLRFVSSSSVVIHMSGIYIHSWDGSVLSFLRPTRCLIWLAHDVVSVELSPSYTLFLIWLAHVVVSVELSPSYTLFVIWLAHVVVSVEQWTWTCPLFECCFFLAFKGTVSQDVLIHQYCSCRCNWPVSPSDLL